VYYNIKIKYKGSEFSLESTNKNITQREMDIYFANIFEVSEEFKSQIKKIIIRNEDLKSISDVESDNNAVNKPDMLKVAQESRNVKTAVLSKPQKIVVQDSIKENLVKKDIQQEPVIEKSVVENNVNQTLKPLNLDNSTEHETKIEEIEIIDDCSLEKLGIKSEIDEILGRTTPQTSLTQDSNKIIEASQTEDVNIIQIDENQKVETQEISSLDNNEDTLEFMELEEASINDISNEEAATQDSKERDEFVNLEQLIISEEPQVQTAQEENKVLADENLLILNDGKSGDLSFVEDAGPNKEEELKQKKANSLDNILNLMQKEFDAVDLGGEKHNGPINNSSSNDLDKEIKETFIEHEIPQLQIKENQTAKLETKLTPLEPEVSKVDDEKIANNVQNNPSDYASFRQRYNKIIEIEDEFLVCASYFKNALQQPNFTIKTLNSKLFPVINKIADLSVVQGLLDKQYITIILGQEVNYYAISDSGQAFIDTRLIG